VYLPVSLHVGYRCVACGSLLPLATLTHAIRKEQPGGPHQRRHSCAVCKQLPLHTHPALPIFHLLPSSNSAEGAVMRALAGPGSGDLPAPPASRLAICSGKPIEADRESQLCHSQAVPVNHEAVRLKLRAVSEMRREDIQAYPTYFHTSLSHCDRIATSLPRTRMRAAGSHLDSFAVACCTALRLFTRIITWSVSRTIDQNPTRLCVIGGSDSRCPWAGCGHDEFLLARSG
jgi:hypothetical protein